MGDGGLWNTDCEVTKNDGKANEAILERYMIVLND